jgi:hypothetical protein
MYPVVEETSLEQKDLLNSVHVDADETSEKEDNLKNP